jgi:predicted nucleic acid-binding protein
MSRLVLDASVALKMMFVAERHAALALALQDEFRNQVRELIAPDVLPAEMGHALMRAVRRGLIPQGQGKVLFEDFIVPCPRLYPYGDLYDSAMDIASKLRIGFYDALYVALSEDEGRPLVTADVKLLNSLPSFSIVHLTSL